MWLTFGITIIVAFCWISKCILEKQIKIIRTPLDIPILLFLLSQLISSIFSLDTRVSWLGYYSRFNGGMFSLLSYAFLYFAFVSNIPFKQMQRYLAAMLVGGIIVALWGLPAHFGYDPTCFVFRGNLDVSCWTFAFQPKVRIFSTLGQPDWMAAYLDALVPLALYFSILMLQKKKYIAAGIFGLTSILFYVDLIYTGSKSAYLALLVEVILFIGGYLWIYRQVLKEKLPQQLHIFLGSILILFFILTFFIGQPVPQLNIFTLQGIRDHFAVKMQQTPPSSSTSKQASAPVSAGEFGGTDSGKIRLFVWQGALAAWLAHPIFGTGVETFAFAYYQFRPAGHNMTSEWDYLYNKAHNEYLNYLATTGIVGLVTYLFMIGVFFFVTIQTSLRKTQQPIEQLLVVSLVTGYISILITNFFGFSVVIMNVFLFLFPAFVFMKQNMSKENKALLLPKEQTDTEPSGLQWLGVTICAIVAIYVCYALFAFWNADKAYALGQNLDHVGQYQQAYSYLHTAVTAFPAEPTFQDEMSLNDAILAASLVSTNATAASQLAREAVQTSNMIVTQHPNNVTYWKDRVRILYTLGQYNASYNQAALASIQKAAELAPTDAKVWYNYGLIAGQSGNIQSAITILQKTTQLKPDYKDAYYALGLYYRQAAVNKAGTVIDQTMEQKAVETMQYILNHFNATDTQALGALKTWGITK